MHECPHVPQRPTPRAAATRPLELFLMKASAFLNTHVAWRQPLLLAVMLGAFSCLPSHLEGATVSEFAEELNTSLDVPVVVVNYVPVGYSVASTQVLKGAAATTYAGTATVEQTGKRVSTTLVPGSVTGAQRLAEFLTQSTVYQAYKARYGITVSQTPAVTFRIVDTITVLQRRDDPAFVTFGTKNATLGYNYFSNIDGYARGTQTDFLPKPALYRDPLPYLFDRIQICKYVAGDASVFSDASKAAPVRMIFFQNPGQAKVNPFESTAAGPFGFLGNNPDVQPLFCAGGNPLAVSQQASAAATYHVIGYSGTAAATSLYPTGNSVHDFGHHYEQLFTSLSGDYFFSSPSAPFAGDLVRTGSYNGIELDPSTGIPVGGYKDFPDFGIRVEVPSSVAWSSGTFRITKLAGATIPTRTFSASLQGQAHPEVPLGSTFTLAQNQRATLQGYDLTFLPHTMTPTAIYAAIYRPGDQFGVVRRCGYTHGGSNAEGSYVLGWANLFFKARTDCENWTPDELGAILTNVTCLRWVTGTNPTCAEAPGAGYRGAELDFYQYVMQSVPGLNNKILLVRNGRLIKMRNLWAIVGNYDAARRRARDLFYDTGTTVNAPSLTGLGTSYVAGNRIQVRWDPPSQTVTGYNLFRREQLWSDAWSQFHRVNNTLLTTASFTDGVDLPLIPGRLYEYEVRSVAAIPLTGAAFQSETGPRNLTIAAPDTAPPTVAITYPTSGNMNTLPPVIRGTAVDNQYGSGLQKVLVRINGGGWQPATGLTSWTYAPAFAGDGQYLVEALAIDWVNNLSPIKSALIRIDRIPPVISSVSVTNITTTEATITWTTNEPATSQVSYNVYDPYLRFSSGVNSALVTSHSTILSGFSANNLIYYQVTSRDAAGNMSASSVASFRTLADSTPPVISNINATNLTSSGTEATITWTTNELATSQVRYGLTTSYGIGIGDLYTRVITHSVPLSQLTPGTLYHYQVESTDASGNLAMSGDRTFTTPYDTTPPIISGLTATGALRSTTAYISWMTNEPADGVVEYGRTTSLGGSVNTYSSSSTSHSVTITGLSSLTTYYYRVKSKDLRGNLATSSLGTFTTLEGVPPIINSVSATNITRNGAVISCTTNEPTSFSVAYGPTTSYGNTRFSTAPRTITPGVTLSGLSPGTLYHYKVLVSDAAGNSTTSGDAAFTTAP